MDFNGPVDFVTFCHQMELVIKDRELLLQAAFDAFDTNNDDRISELDLFKFIFQCEKVNHQHKNHD